jgi:hypothetical protein
MNDHHTSPKDMQLVRDAIPELPPKSCRTSPDKAIYKMASDKEPVSWIGKSRDKRNALMMVRILRPI